MQLDTIAAQSIHVLSQMISTPSLSCQEGKSADLLENFLRSLSPQSSERIGNNLIATWSGPKPGPTLLLCCNHDTLPPAKGWSRHPYKPSVEDDRVYGLGANNAGASLVSMLGAIKATLPLQAGRLVLCLAAEKEHGGNGFRAIEPKLPRYDAGIFGAPTNMRVVTEMRGRMELAMHSRTKTGPTSGVARRKSAIDVFLEDLAKIRSLDLADRSAWGGATIEPTAIEGGKSSSHIADLVTATLDVRSTPTRTDEWILEQLRALDIEFYIASERRRPVSCPAGHPILLAVKETYPQASNYTFEGTNDIAYSTAPSIVMGPGKPERAHIADEFCTYTDICEGIAGYQAIVSTYLGSLRHDSLGPTTLKPHASTTSMRELQVSTS